MTEHRVPTAQSRNLCARWSSGVMSFAFDRQAGADPVLLAFLVLADVCITHRRQLTAGYFRGVSSGASAVRNDLGVLVGQQLRCDLANAVVRDVDRAGEMRMPKTLRRQRLDQ